MTYKDTTPTFNAGDRKVVNFKDFLQHSDETKVFESEREKLAKDYSDLTDEIKEVLTKYKDSPGDPKFFDELVKATGDDSKLMIKSLHYFSHKVNPKAADVNSKLGELYLELVKKVMEKYPELKK